MIGTIAELRMLIKDATMRRPHLTSRLENAAFHMLLRPIERVDGDLWRVGSEDGPLSACCGRSVAAETRRMNYRDDESSTLRPCGLGT